jgi:pimeloyl-ACP methyl ester carboxylesterase
VKRRIALGVLVVLALAIAVNTLVIDRQTKPAKADLGRIVDLQGGDLQVRTEGRRRRGTPIVLLHGFTASMHWWSRAAPRLARRRRVIRIDLLGHGGSEKPRDGYQPDQQADRVAEVLGKLRVRRAIVVGHSMGGGVAATLAERRPGLVRGVVVVGSAPDPKYSELPFTGRLAMWPVIGQLINRLAPDSQVRKSLESAFAKGDVPDRFVEDVNRMTYSSFRKSSRESRDFYEDLSAADRRARSRRPLLVIFGREDEITEPKAAYRWKTPRSRVRTLAGVGHSPQWERPAVTSRLILRFARRVAP